MDAIGQARIFLLCLSQNSAVSEHVLNEVEMAYNKKRTASDLLIEPLCLEVLDLDAPEFDEIMYYIRRINFIAPSNLASSKAIAQEIITKNKDFLKLENIHIKKERTKSAYFTSERETARLELQTRLLRKFDGEIYRQVFEEYEEPDILDVGCGNGSMIFDRMDGCCENFRLIGIERDPDEENVFERIYRICDNNETSGERRNGRQIFTNLHRAGFRRIELKKSGFTTIGLSYEEKEAFWGMYFNFILGDIKWMHEKYPADESIADDCEWYTDNFEDIFEMFMKDDFIFSLGFQLYLAKK